MKRALILIVSLTMAFAVTSCKKKGDSGDDGHKKKAEKKQKMEKKKEAEKEAKKEQKKEAADDKKEADSEAKKVVLEPKGNEMKFKQTEFTVKPGQKIHLVFNNTATAKAMKHNVIVVGKNEANGGKDAAKRIAQAGMKAGKKAEFVPEDDAILASTGLSDPGGKVEVTFTAPEKPGKYPYICTYPGHFPMMQGDMIVGE